MANRTWNIHASPTAILFVLGIGTATAYNHALFKGTPDIYAEIERNYGVIEIPVSSPVSISDTQLRQAKIAWQYFEHNTSMTSGFVNSVDGYPSTTLWDQGGYVFALIAARKFELITDYDYRLRVQAFLRTLQELDLVAGVLPNKAYNTDTLDMTDYQNRPIAAGIGWSALDIARLLIALRALEVFDPGISADVHDVISAWSLANMIEYGEFVSSEVTADGMETLQEGRIGYEQYAARGAGLWGLDVSRSNSYDIYVTWVDVDGISVPSDSRSHRMYDAITPTLSEPSFLEGLEIGFNDASGYAAQQIYFAQEKRYAETGQLTSVSEDHLDQAPYFLYSTVYGNGNEWAVLTETGERHDDLRTISTKASFAWDALFRTHYTGLLMDKISDQYDVERGWFAGIYEASGDPNAVLSLNTNAVILEALHFQAFGPYIPAPSRKSVVDLPKFN